MSNLHLLTLPEERHDMPEGRQPEVTGSARGSRAAAPDPLLGRVINGRFKIVSVIARGGMGKVYRAEQAPLGRICALKVLSPKYEGDHDPEFHRRFFLEASTAAKLSHPNTVTVFDYGQSDDDIYYIAMEYIEGKTLHRVLREDGPFPEARAAHIARQICRSLREAHGLGVVHRDLKPGNVLLVDHEDEHDHVKVLDFGLVKDTQSGEDLTQQGLFMGSPKYMAPEQIAGSGVSARTDIYALGVMMYEMLSGQVPFDKGASVGTLMSHVNDPVPPMQAHNPSLSISQTMEGIVYRCLEKDPAQRFSSMNELLAALKFAAGGISTRDTGETAPMLPGAASHRPSAPSYPSLPAYPRPPSYPSSPSYPSGPSYPPAPSYPPTPSYSTTSDIPGLSTPNSSPPTSSPVTLTAPIATDSGPRPPAAPLFVAPSITDAMGTDAMGTDPMGADPVGARPAPHADGLSSTQPGASPGRRLAPWAIGAALAAVVGVAAVMTRSPAPGTSAAAREQGAGRTPAAEAPPAASAPAASAPAARPLQVESTPPGAAVREGNKELCAETPCEIIWRGTAAALASEHELVFEKAGYRPAIVRVSGAEERVRARLDPAPIAAPGAPSKPRANVQKADPYKSNPY
ncbi:serine/threonine-protein kinase [Sorangium sp. So ce185]|uniref:serine/threonine-protein kinase n=1 Tax=Sorangium sp. So ce185 TaxID=3133287 RepID=UPI003F5EF829